MAAGIIAGFYGVHGFDLEGISGTIACLPYSTHASNCETKSVSGQHFFLTNVGSDASDLERVVKSTFKADSQIKFLYLAHCLCKPDEITAFIETLGSDFSVKTKTDEESELITHITIQNLNPCNEIYAYVKIDNGPLEKKKLSDLIGKKK
jgi:hypothetical protein